MEFLIDTDVAIHLRDKSPEITDRISALPSSPAISIITRVELEGGVFRVPALAATRRARLASMLATLPCLTFDGPAAEAYGRLVGILGYSRPRLLDRMIAAQAIVAGATLITINGADFKGIPGLDLEIWPSPPPLA